MIKVSVLMTVYNSRQYLGFAIDSVLKQSYPDFEFVIVDDASNDGSNELIKAYQDPRIRLIRNPSNCGQNLSLNTGLRQARGEYIARIDSDDIAFPHWLRSQVDFLGDRGRIDVLSAGLVTFDENGLGKAYFSPSCREDILLTAIIKPPVNHGGALMKKDAVLEAGGYNNEHKIAADYGLWIRLLKQDARLTSNPDIVMAVRRHCGSQSKKNNDLRWLKAFAGIAGDYVLFLTGRKLPEGDILLVSRAHYDEGALDRSDFLRAVQVHGDIYASLRQDLNLSKKKVRFWHKKQARTFFLRRIHHYILLRDRSEVRWSAAACLKMAGFKAVFAGLFALSFFPQAFLDFVSTAYNFIHTAKAGYFLRREKNYSQLKGLGI